MLKNKNLKVFVCVSVVFVLMVCVDMLLCQQGMVQGVGIGVLGGVVFGVFVGGGNGVIKGVVIGGIVGVIGGNIWLKKQEECQCVLEQQIQGIGVEVICMVDNQFKFNILSDIFFDVGCVDIKFNLCGVFDDFVYGLKDDFLVCVCIIGYIDNIGIDVINDLLFECCVESVCNYLVDCGVSGGCIEMVGCGEWELIVDNVIEVGCVKNWCVEIYICELEQWG